MEVKLRRRMKPIIDAIFYVISDLKILMFYLIVASVLEFPDKVSSSVEKQTALH